MTRAKYNNAKLARAINAMLALPPPKVTGSRKPVRSSMYKDLRAMHANHVPFAHYTAAPAPARRAPVSPTGFIVPAYGPGGGRAKFYKLEKPKKKKKKKTPKTPRKKRTKKVTKTKLEKLLKKAGW